MLLQSQRFVIDHIYCAPSQDRQYTFKMVRVNKQQFPSMRQVSIYGTVKPLPNTTSYFHVFTIGNLFPEFLNLHGQAKQWFKDEWVKFSDDMNARKYVAKIYNDDGVVFPRSNVYYSYIDENSLIVAVEVNSYLQLHFDISSFKYLNVYSSAYFQSDEYNQLPVRKGVECFQKVVGNNTEKAALQTKIATLKSYGGDVFVYVDGYYTDTLTLNVPNQSLVEVVYDQSVIGRFSFDIQGLRTFDSVKDNKMKYLLFREKQDNQLHYQDDTELYVTQKDTPMNLGLLLYRHQDYVLRNVTDKDYSLYTAFVSNTAAALTKKVGGGLKDKTITLYLRRSGREKELVYSAMKLHELYKLPTAVQHDVISNTNYTVDFYRAEQLENSMYFQCVSAPTVNQISPEMAFSAIGYNGMGYYYANTPVRTDGALTINVPELYQYDSIAFEYDTQGKYLRFVNSNGPLYTCSSSDVAYVEFLAGSIPQTYGRLYEPTETVTLADSEYRILSAYFNQSVRTSIWQDITNDPARCTVQGNTWQFNETEGRKIKVVCLNTPRVYDLEMALDSGNLEITLAQPEERDGVAGNYVLDVAYENLELYLNGHRLTQGLDFFVKFPVVSICTKRYLDFTKPTQSVHVRMSGFTLDPSKINQLELRGFVNNGTLTRNKRYDIREDKVLSVYVDGKLRDRSQVRYSEEDNTVRLTHPTNGQPYVIKEPFIAIRKLTGVDSYPLYNKNIQTNQRISDLYDLIHPEPAIDQFNAIGSKHLLFSPLLSTVINDILEGVIPANFYTSPYDDTAILQLLDNQYKTLFELDPIRANLPVQIVEIHPHIGNATIELDLLQYRFVQNVIRVVTAGRSELIHISGYLSLTV